MGEWILWQYSVPLCEQCCKKCDVMVRSLVIVYCAQNCDHLHTRIYTANPSCLQCDNIFLCLPLFLLQYRRDCCRYQAKLPCRWLFTKIGNPALAQAPWTSHCSTSLHIPTVSWLIWTPWENNACLLMSLCGPAIALSHATGKLALPVSFSMTPFVCFLTCDFHSGSSAFVFCRAVLAACSRYFEAMFSGGLRESLDTDVNFRDSIHPEVLLWISLWTVRLACSSGSLFSVLFIKKTNKHIYI